MGERGEGAASWPCLGLCWTVHGVSDWAEALLSAVLGTAIPRCLGALRRAPISGRSVLSACVTGMNGMVVECGVKVRQVAFFIAQQKGRAWGLGPRVRAAEADVW